MDYTNHFADFIYRNIHNLCSCTEIDCEFLLYMLQVDVLTKQEQDNIEAEKTPYEKASRFWSLIAKKKTEKVFEVIEKVAKETGHGRLCRELCNYRTELQVLGVEGLFSSRLTRFMVSLYSNGKINEEQLDYLLQTRFENKSLKHGDDPKLARHIKNFFDSLPNDEPIPRNFEPVNGAVGVSTVYEIHKCRDSFENLEADNQLPNDSYTALSLQWVSFTVQELINFFKSNGNYDRWEEITSANIRMKFDNILDLPVIKFENLKKYIFHQLEENGLLWKPEFLSSVLFFWTTENHNWLNEMKDNVGTMVDLIWNESRIFKFDPQEKVLIVRDDPTMTLDDLLSRFTATEISRLSCQSVDFNIYNFPKKLTRLHLDIKKPCSSSKICFKIKELTQLEELSVNCSFKWKLNLDDWSNLTYLKTMSLKSATINCESSFQFTPSVQEVILYICEISPPVKQVLNLAGTLGFRYFIVHCARVDSGELSVLESISDDTLQFATKKKVLKSFRITDFIYKKRVDIINDTEYFRKLFENHAEPSTALRNENS